MGTPQHMPTPPPTPPSINRGLLGEAGLVLDDDTYVQVIAGLGVMWLGWSSSAWGPQRTLRWSPYNFATHSERHARVSSLPDLLRFRDEWTKALANSADKRVTLPEKEFRDRSPDLIEVKRILDHPAVGAKSLFADKEASHFDVQWRWPLRIATLPNDLESLELTKLSTTWPSQSLAEVHALTREQSRCEILILKSSVRNALLHLLELRHAVRAGYVVLISPLDLSWNSLRSQMDLLFSETQAGGVSIVSPPSGGLAWKNINELVTQLSHNRPFDFALAAAFPGGSSLHLLDVRLLDVASLTNTAKNLGRRLRKLPDKAALSVPDDAAQRINVGWTKAMPPADLGMALETRPHDIPFDQESLGCTGLTEIAVAERKARLQATRAETPRFLQGDLAAVTEGALVPETRGLRVGTRYQLEVFIGPAGEGAISSDRSLDETVFDWRTRDSYTLQVLFVEPRQWDEPLKGTLELPREGRSSKCRFVFVPTRSGPFAGRVIVYYQGRVLETALLQATVLAEGEDWTSKAIPKPLHFAVEAEVRRSLGTLDERRRFDCSLVLNHSAGGEHSATAAGKDGAFIASLDGIENQLANINALLTDVAYKEKAYAKGLLKGDNPKLLCNLANEGNVLYRNLVLDYLGRSSAAEALRGSRYLQIVSARPDALVPLEFVYEYPPPKKGAPICKNAPDALIHGCCPKDCQPTESPAPHVCPLGFWGLCKVIERHVYDPELPKPARVETDTGDPVPGRDSLLMEGASLVAASQQIPDPSCDQLAKSIQAAWHGDVALVKKWCDWKAAVEAKQPVLFIALPHADGTGANISLEISGDVMKSIQIDQAYVCSDPTHPPIVLLLGCDVANTATPGAYARQIAIFRQAKAALVLGTVATVLGTDGAKVAERIVTRLSDTARHSERFGDVLLQVKQKAVADSLMVAMCLVAFGDADWYLK